MLTPSGKGFRAIRPMYRRFRRISRALCGFFGPVMPGEYIAKSAYCGIDPETPTHLCKDCTFSRQVWSFIKRWFSLSVIDTVGMIASLHKYWRKCRMKIDKDQRKAFDGIMIYFWWNLWKETNRRTFQNKLLQPSQVALLCKEDIEQYQLATRFHDGPQQE